MIVVKTAETTLVPSVINLGEIYYNITSERRGA